MNFKIINPASGIYGILNTWNGKLYIGSAINLKGRLHTHKSNLNLNKHSNKHLQAACADKRNEMRKIYNGNQNFVVLS